MKQLPLLLIPLIMSFTIKGQDNEYEFTDRKIIAIPAAQTDSTAAIAAFIKANFSTDKEKLRAAYTWVITNIKYDTDSMYSINWSGGTTAKITAAMRRRKGVCENFAAVFNDIAVKSGLTSYIVDGYTKQGGRIDRTGHTWCVANIDGHWLCCDPTWDKDANGDTHFFLTDPEIFISTHMPFDPMWELLTYPVTHQQFNSGSIPKANKQFYNYSDSIKSFSHLNELDQLQAAYGRMEAADKKNELLKIRIEYTNMQIGLIYEDKDMHVFNDAVSDLNHATATLNDLLQYRNNGLIPARPETEINVLLHSITADLTASYKKMSSLSRFNEQYDPSELKDRLDTMAKRTAEQKQFFERYMAANNADKKKLIYGH